MPRHLIFIELIQSSDFGVVVVEKTQSLLYTFSLGGLKMKTKLAVTILFFSFFCTVHVGRKNVF